MKLKLIKVKFDETFAYKYLPFEHCCDAIGKNETITFTDQNFAYDIEDDSLYPIPKFCTSYHYNESSYDDTWEMTENFPINYCPHCGEKIEIEVIDETDISSQFTELETKRKHLFRAANKTDSKKRENELREQVRELDQKINWFFSLAEWNGEYTDEEKI